MLPIKNLLRGYEINSKKNETDIILLLTKNSNSDNKRVLTKREHR